MTRAGTQTACESTAASGREYKCQRAETCVLCCAAVARPSPAGQPGSCGAGPAAGRGLWKRRFDHSVPAQQRTYRLCVPGREHNSRLPGACCRRGPRLTAPAPCARRCACRAARGSCAGAFWGGARSAGRSCAACLSDSARARAQAAPDASLTRGCAVNTTACRRSEERAAVPLTLKCARKCSAHAPQRRRCAHAPGRFARSGRAKRYVSRWRGRPAPHSAFLSRHRDGSARLTSHAPSGLRSRRFAAAFPRLVHAFRRASRSCLRPAAAASPSRQRVGGVLRSRSAGCAARCARPGDPRDGHREHRDKPHWQRHLAQVHRRQPRCGVRKSRRTSAAFRV